jgi:hypothetical protein
VVRRFAVGLAVLALVLSVIPVGAAASSVGHVEELSASADWAIGPSPAAEGDVGEGASIWMWRGPQASPDGQVADFVRYERITYQVVPGPGGGLQLEWTERTRLGVWPGQLAGPGFPVGTVAIDQDKHVFAVDMDLEGEHCTQVATAPGSSIVCEPASRHIEATLRRTTRWAPFPGRILPGKPDPSWGLRVALPFAGNGTAELRVDGILVTDPLSSGWSTFFWNRSTDVTPGS